MKLLKRTANHARNAFDMSHRHLVIANFGELLPITCLEVVPDDYVELSVADLLRAAPMVTSPFLRAKQHIDVYYVPYCDIWSQFEAFMTKRSEPKHANMYGQFAVPHINLYNLQKVIENTDTTADDVVGMDFIRGAHKITDLLGYGRVDVSGSVSTHPSVNLWRLAAYNKIWYEHYRQQYYDSGLRFLSDNDFVNGVSNPAVIFNFDDLLCTSIQNSDLYAAAANTVIDQQTTANDLRIREMTQMRYRLWKKDLFTGLMPSTQFGNVSSISLSGAGSLSDFYLYSNSNTASVALGIHNPSKQVAATSTTVAVSQQTINDTTFHVTDVNRQRVSLATSASGVLNILDLRKSEALQIWREAALTAGNRIADNMRSHYGSEAEYAMHESQLIGSVSAPLNISDVNATAQTTQTPASTVNTSLGDVAGKGISTIDDKVIKFKAKKFGVILVMFSLLPEAEYQSDGIDRMNQLLEQEDYFVPEYMDLGFEAVSSLDFYNMPTTAAKVVGYAPRYIGYKQKLDKCFSGFKSNDPFAPWASPKTDVAQAMASTDGVMPLQCLYVNPDLFNRNFVVGTSSSAQFICDFFFDCTKVSPMSVSSLPRI